MRSSVSELSWAVSRQGDPTRRRRSPTARACMESRHRTAGTVTFHPFMRKLSAEPPSAMVEHRIFGIASPSRNPPATRAEAGPRPRLSPRRRCSPPAHHGHGPPLGLGHYPAQAGRRANERVRKRARGEPSTGGVRARHRGPHRKRRRGPSALRRFDALARLPASSDLVRPRRSRRTPRDSRGDLGALRPLLGSRPTPHLPPTPRTPGSPS
jgi:hypothetical protein